MDGAGLSTTAPCQYLLRRSSVSSAPMVRARPRCCIWPSGCSRPRRAPSPSSAMRQRAVGHNSERSASWRRTRRPTPDSPSPSTSIWAPGSTRTGTASLPRNASISSAWTQSSEPGRSRAASGPSSPSRWRSPSSRNSSCSMSQWPAWTHWLGVSSYRASWRSLPSTG